MPAVDPGFTNPTGKNNLVTSFNKWLELNVPTAGADDFVYDFLHDQDPQVFPRVDVYEVSDASRAATSFGKTIAPFNTHPTLNPATEGQQSAITMQVDIQTDDRRSKTAKRDMYKIRDRFRYGFDNAGVADDVTGAEKVPPILVLDFDDGAAETGIIAQVSLEDGAIQETYVPPEEGKPSIHLLSLTVRLEWFELN